MKTGPTGPKDIDEYIAGFPEDVQELLEKVRATIRQAAPGAEEAIKYQIPTFTLNGNLVHFAAFKNHIGFYPAPRGIEAFKDDLISRIVKFRAEENLAKAKTKRRK